MELKWICGTSFPCSLLESRRAQTGSAAGVYFSSLFLDEGGIGRKIRGRPAAAGRINGCSHERPKNLAPVSKLAASTCLENVDDLFSLLLFSSFLFYHLLMLRQPVTSLGSIDSRGLIYYHWSNIFINTSVLLVKTIKTISIRTFSFVIDKVITKNMQIWEKKNKRYEFSTKVG